jgi:hypothetical protein
MLTVPRTQPSHAAVPDATGASALSRRRVLAGAGRGLLALAFGGTAAAACASKPSGPDPLEAELSAARTDSELAAAAAKAAAPAMVPALIEVSTERARHATAIVEELSRAAGRPTPTPGAETTAPTGGAPTGSPPTGGASTPPAPPPSLGDVVTALRRSADDAATLAPTLSGYRAGLMGSIAAACTTSWMVGLTPAEPRQR